MKKSLFWAMCIFSFIGWAAPNGSANLKQPSSLINEFKGFFRTKGKKRKDLDNVSNQIEKEYKKTANEKSDDIHSYVQEKKGVSNLVDQYKKNFINTLSGQPLKQFRALQKQEDMLSRIDNSIAMMQENKMMRQFEEKQKEFEEKEKEFEEKEKEFEEKEKEFALQKTTLNTKIQKLQNELKEKSAITQADPSDEISKLKSENQQLKEANQKLTTTSVQPDVTENKKLAEQNKKLQEQLNQLQSENQLLTKKNSSYNSYDSFYLNEEDQENILAHWSKEPSKTIGKPHPKTEFSDEEMQKNALKMNTLQNENTELQKQLQTVTQQNNEIKKSSENQITTLKSEIEQLKNQVQELKTNHPVANTVDQKQVNHTLDNQQNSYADQIQQMSQTYTKKMQEMQKKYDQQISQGQSDLDQKYKHIENRNVELVEKNNTLEQDIRNLQTQLQQAQQTHQTNEEIRYYQTQLNHETDANNQLRQQIEQLHSEKFDSFDNQKFEQNQDTYNRIKELQQENEALQKQLSIETKRSNEMRAGDQAHYINQIGQTFHNHYSQTIQNLTEENRQKDQKIQELNEKMQELKGADIKNIE